MLGAVSAATPANAVTSTESLSAVSCVSVRYCVAVGIGPVDARGTTGLISLIWNGAKWRRAPMKAPSRTEPAVLQSVSCKSAAYCVAVGASGTDPGERPIVQTWNGRTWTLALPPKPADTLDSSLDGVSCAAVRACVAVGSAQTPSRNDLPLVETLSGAKWTIRGGALPRGLQGGIVGSVSCPAVTYCVLAGQYDTTAAFAPLFESWNGKAFARMRGSAPDDVEASGVSCVSARSCVAVDDSVDMVTFDVTALTEVWNGRAWSFASPFPNTIPTSVLNAVSCAPGRCLVVGATGPALGASDDGARASAVAFNGRRWVMTGFPAPPRQRVSELNGISCPSAGFCVAVGDAGPSNGPTSALTGFWDSKSWRLVGAS
jgi:hypothetical protein